ncbi:MAG: hypothetical protein NTV33_07375 [Coprothermobacterota bacterium]|nr:hypothetical protein [Coprothermobacterota bacterium]
MNTSRTGFKRANCLSLVTNAFAFSTKQVAAWMASAGLKPKRARS